MAKEGILSSVSLTSVRVSRRPFFCLSTLARRPSKELWQRDPTRPEVRVKNDEGRWELGVETRSRETDIQGPGLGVRQSRPYGVVGSETGRQEGKTMIRDGSAF